ncbi:hypothetical protein KM043_008176 [Ampulex compressa]|nr:hypothetical protein KM043_008176 [Ampulex compressa]
MEISGDAWRTDVRVKGVEDCASEVGQIWWMEFWEEEEGSRRAIVVGRFGSAKWRIENSHDRSRDRTSRWAYGYYMQVDRYRRTRRSTRAEDAVRKAHKSTAPGIAAALVGLEY